MLQAPHAITRPAPPAHPPARLLQEVRQQTQCRQIAFVSLNKESHVLEAPEVRGRRAPRALQHA